MKKSLLLLMVLSVVFTSCNQNDEEYLLEGGTSLLGTWQLTEVYADPGDGSGSFEEVQSDKKIEFRSRNRVSSNGDLCSLSTDTGNETKGTFTISGNEGTITTDNCGDDINFTVAGDVLTISFTYCIEGCAMSFVKIKD